MNGLGKIMYCANVIIDFLKTIFLCENHNAMCEFCICEDAHKSNSYNSCIFIINANQEFKCKSAVASVSISHHSELEFLITIPN